MFRFNCILLLPSLVVSTLAFYPVIYPSKNEFKSVPNISNHSKLHLLKRECGPPPQQKNHAKYITSVFDFPWMVLIKYKSDYTEENKFKCSGALISPKYVLTAAHCLVNLPGNAQVESVRIGEHDTSIRRDCENVLTAASAEACAPATEDIFIHSIIPHPKYATNENKLLDFDIGLIRLSAMVMSGSIKPVCLPITKDLIDMDLEGLPAIVTGYEFKYKALKKSYMPVLVNTRCNEVYEQSNYEIGDSQICAGGQDGADWCVKISTGLHVPATIGFNKRYVLFAVPSGVPNKCNVAGMPRIYTKVIYYLNWILDNMEI